MEEEGRIFVRGYPTTDHPCFYYSQEPLSHEGNAYVDGRGMQLAPVAAVSSPLASVQTAHTRKQ